MEDGPQKIAETLGGLIQLCKKCMHEVSSVVGLHTTLEHSDPVP